MNINRLILATVAISALFGHPTFADTGKFSIAAKAGTTLESIPTPIVPGANVSFEGDTAAGISLSYNLDANSSIDLEFVRGGATATVSNAFNSADLDVTINTTALYWFQKTSGDWYFSYKIGILQEELSSDDIPSETDTGLSFGVGGGYRFNPNIEIALEYVKVEADVEWALLSVRFTPGVGGLF